jgi:hypothetical protein
MNPLLHHIEALTHTILSGACGLDDTLADLDDWLAGHAGQLTESDRRTFSAALNVESSNDDRSLIDSILKLHATRRLHQHDLQTIPPPALDDTPNAYVQARNAFHQALRASEDGITEARIDIAIANAHNLLGDVAANRRWLDSALARLPDLAAADLTAMAQDIPAMPLPRIGLFKRLGLKLVGFNFDHLDDKNRETLAIIAKMQVDQIVLLAHLLGTSFEAIHEHRRAQRAFRVAAHLIVRHAGLQSQAPGQLLEIAESLHRSEPEAAHILARQVISLCDVYEDEDADPDLLARAQTLLTPG